MSGADRVMDRLFKNATFERMAESEYADTLNPQPTQPRKLSWGRKRLKQNTEQPQARVETPKTQPSEAQSKTPFMDDFVKEYFKQKGWDYGVSIADANGRAIFEKRYQEASNVYEQQYGFQHRAKQGAGLITEYTVSSALGKKMQGKEVIGLDYALAPVEAAGILPIGWLARGAKVAGVAGKGGKWATEAGETAAKAVKGVEKAVEGAPPIKPPELPKLLTPDDELKQFGQAVKSKKTEDLFVAQKEAWGKERTTRSKRFQELLEAEQTKGVDTKTAIERATEALKGEYPRELTGLGLSEEATNAAYDKIVRVITNDPSIPAATKGFEIQATKTALDNALAGKPIPSIAGVKGGSAKSRLLKIFDDSPDIKKIVENPTEWEKARIEASRPHQLDQVTVDYLRTLKESGVAKEFASLPASERTAIEKGLNTVGANIIDALNIPRAIMASGDLSFGLRQGLILGTRHPIEWAKQFARGLNAFRSEDIAKRINNLVMNDADVMWGIEKGYLDPISLAKEAGYMQRSESFASHLAERIPVLGKLVRASARSFAVSSNSLQTGVWKQGVKALKTAGADLNEFKSLGEFVNWGVGRGNLPKWGAKAAPILNATLFSPRLMFARLQLPSKLFSKSAYVRGQAWQTLGTFLAFGGSALGLYALNGGKISFDPRSSEFAKVKVGNTRLDIWGGYVQYVRFVSQVSTGKYVDSLGRVQDSKRFDTVLRFFQSKDSPAVSLIADLLKGTDYAGNKLSDNVLDQVRNRILPLSLNDMIDAVVQEGAVQGIGLGALSALGVGVVTYDKQAAVRDLYKDAVQEYISIPSDDDERKAKKMPSKEDYRKTNPDIDAALFVIGETETVKTAKAADRVIQIIKEEGLDPKEIKSVKAWQEDQAKKQELGVKDTNITATDRLMQYILGLPISPLVTKGSAGTSLMSLQTKTSKRKVSWGKKTAARFK